MFFIKTFWKPLRQNEQKQRIEKKGCDSHHFTSDWVRAHLDYFIHFWKPHFQRDIDKWEHIQRRVRRMVKETHIMASEVLFNEPGMWLRRSERVVHIHWEGCQVEKVVWYSSLVKRMWTSNQVNQVQILICYWSVVWPLTKFLNFSEPCFSCWLKIEEHNISSWKIAMRIKEDNIYESTKHSTWFKNIFIS